MHFAWEFGILFLQCCVPEANTAILGGGGGQTNKQINVISHAPPLLKCSFSMELVPRMLETPPVVICGYCQCFTRNFLQLVRAKENQIMCGLSKAGMHI